jgi:hypothetical protein
MRSKFTTCTAVKPRVIPNSFCIQFAGKATIPAINTMAVSMPLHPASIGLLVVSCGI